ncbi:MAG: site-specific DNA-methyltransferase [Anaerolineaceae bacterium]|nr:MAG: site-specific DNA-methyltransferase [Anaerolineaceae bacterium]
MKRLIVDGVKVQTCVTSPPYWGLRDYGNNPTVWGGDTECDHEWGPQETGFKNSTKGNAGSTTASDPNHTLGSRFDSSHTWCQKCGAWLGCFGLEPTPQLYVEHSVEIFRFVRDLLADDGTLWLNLGDTYAAARSYQVPDNKYKDVGNTLGHTVPPGLKQKDLVGIPWMVAFALRADGWYLRCDIVWEKAQCMPESVKDRPTKSHEYIFLLSKTERYYYDAAAIMEPASLDTHARYARGRSDSHKYADGGPGGQTIARSLDHMVKAGVNPKAAMNAKGSKQNASFSNAVRDVVEMRNKRSVWKVATQPYSGSHFATFPEKLIEPCILAGSRAGDIVLDPFFGSGTAGQVAEQLGRQWIGCEIQRAYEPLQKERTAQVGLLL